MEYEFQEITPNRGPNVKFHGRLLGEYSARSKSAQRWTDFEVWETRGGAWIVVITARTSFEGEREWETVHVIDKGERQDRIIEAMDAMQWHYGARAIAKKAGWNLTIEVE